MKTVSNEQRARYFMAFGFAVSEPPEVWAEVDALKHKYERYEIIRDIYAEQIIEAMRFYTDDLILARNSPKDKSMNCSELEADIFDELVELSPETLAVLAAAMMAKAGAN